MDTSTTAIVTNELGAQTGLAVAKRKIAKYTKANDKESWTSLLPHGGGTRNGRMPATYSTN